MSDMAKVSITSCDKCGRHEPEVTVTSYKISTALRAVPVDLCDDDAEPILELMGLGSPRRRPSIRIDDPSGKPKRA